MLSVMRFCQSAGERAGVSPSSVYRVAVPAFASPERPDTHVLQWPTYEDIGVVQLYATVCVCAPVLFGLLLACSLRRVRKGCQVVGIALRCRFLVIPKRQSFDRGCGGHCGDW